MTGYVISTYLTDFQKNKQKEWKKFSERYPWSWKEELKNDWLYVICFIALLIGVITLRLPQDY